MVLFIAIQESAIPAKELFTPESLTTLVGLTGMVYVASNSLQRAFNFNPKWLALVIAEILSLFALFYAFKQSGATATSMDYLIAVFNGFLVYLTSAGATAGVNNVVNREPPDDKIDVEGRYRPISKSRRRFNSPWF